MRVRGCGFVGGGGPRLNQGTEEEEEVRRAPHSPPNNHQGHTPRHVPSVKEMMSWFSEVTIW